MKRFLPLLLALALLPSVAAAPSLDYLGIEHELNESGAASVKLTLRFDPATNALDYRLPYHITNLSVAADFPEPECVPADAGGRTTISCRFSRLTNEKRQAVLRYDVPEAYGRAASAVFSASYDVPLPVQNAFLLVKLPSNTFLASDIAGQAYSPPDGKTLTDGRSISVFWDASNLTVDTALPIRVLFTLPNVSEQPTDYLIPGIAILAILAVAVASFVTHRYTKRRAGSAVAAVLNPDERRLVDLLEGKGGKSLQKQLVRESDFSKAKVSRLVNSLRARGLVAVEAVSGRENRVVLTLGNAAPKEKVAEARQEQPKPAEGP